MKRRSARLDEPYVYFVDRCLGKKVVPDALRAAVNAGERVEVHDDHFLPDATDVEWLQTVGERKWVVLSQDRNITRNPLDQAALLGANVAFFGLRRGEASGSELAEMLVNCLGALRASLRRFELPVIGSLTHNGDVVVKWAAGERLASPKRIKARRSRAP